MALSDDQRAMLQLLLEGGQSYADIGALLGVDAGEVRSRARTALTEVGGADPDANVGLTDYLLGQADPIGRADVARQLQRDPASLELANKLAAQMRVVAPKAQLPDLPTASGMPAPTAPVGGPGEAAAKATGGARSVLERIGDGVRGLGSRERRLPVALAAAGLLTLIVVLIVTGVFGGDDGGDSGGGEQAGSPEEDLTIVELEPQNGSSASGQVVFARVQDQPVLQVNLAGLEPTAKGQNYIVWLTSSDQVAFPVGFQEADQQGNVTGPAPIPSQLTPLLPQFTAVNVTLASVAEVKAAIKKAAKMNPPIPALVGQSVLRGDIPRDPTDSTGIGTPPSGTTPAPAPTPTPTPAPTP